MKKYFVPLINNKHFINCISYQNRKNEFTSTLGSEFCRILYRLYFNHSEFCSYFIGYIRYNKKEQITIQTVKDFIILYEDNTESVKILLWILKEEQNANVEDLLKQRCKTDSKPKPAFVASTAPFTF